VNIDRLLASVEEYFEIRNEVGGSEDLAVLRAAKERVELALNEYFKSTLDRALLEERRRSSSSTRKIDIVNAGEARVSWEDVVKLIDALNSTPMPIRSVEDHTKLHRWMRTYSDWYNNKRTVSLQPIIAPLDLDLEEVKKTDDENW
jgi:hypothetical protein